MAKAIILIGTFSPYLWVLVGWMWWLNENINHRLRYLSAWFPVGGAVCVVLGDVDLMEELHHWGLYFRFQSSTPFLLCSLDSLLVF